MPILSGENTEGVTIRNLTIQNSLRTNGTGGIILHDPTGTKETPSKLEGCVIQKALGLSAFGMPRRVRLRKTKSHSAASILAPYCKP